MLLNSKTYISCFLRVIFLLSFDLYQPFDAEPTASVATVKGIASVATVRGIASVVTVRGMVSVATVRGIASVATVTGRYRLL